jgi:DNA-binding CsgD family transcriptional regulator
MLWRCDCGKTYRIQLLPMPESLTESIAEPVVIPEARHLTSLELRVLTCIAAGMTDREVATFLDASVHQVRYAVRDAIARLASHSRTEAVAVAITHGLIDLASPLA